MSLQLPAESGKMGLLKVSSMVISEIEENSFLFLMVKVFLLSSGFTKNLKILVT